MDVALLLILPVIGGYYFTSNWNYTRFRSAREEGHRLYFRAVLYGTFLFVGAYVVRVLLIKYCSAYTAFEATLGGALAPLLKPDEDPSAQRIGIVITSFYALLIGIGMWKPLNLLFREDRFLERAVRNNDFERLIYTAVEKDAPLSVTVENQKVYVGFVVKTTNPAQDRKTLGILPIMSGYRREDGRVQFTTFYSDVYEEIERGKQGRLAHLTPEDFEVVLPVDRILSANMFDIVAYEEFGRRSGARKSASKTRNPS
jgi:hypothetical protein